MTTGIQEYQFDHRLDRDKSWQLQSKPATDNSVGRSVERDLVDKWVWLVTDAYLVLPDDCVRGFLREELV